MKKTYKTIKELHCAIKAGKIDESKIEIILDNDQTCFFYGPAEDKNGNDLDNEIVVKSANGHMDIDELYPLLFPKAKVERC